MTDKEAREIIIEERDSLKANPMVKVEDYLYEAFDLAIKALEQTNYKSEARRWKRRYLDLKQRIFKLEEQTRWIPVSERLPERAEWYLTSIKRVDGAVIISWFDGVSFKAEVVAWMPLPQPYKAESEEKE